MGRGPAKPFKKRNKLAKGGAREGAGRPADWLKEEAAKVGDPLKIIRFYYDVADGQELEQIVTDTGETVRVPAAVKDRLRAGEQYLDRAVGKVPQAMEVTGANGSEFASLSARALEALLGVLTRRVGDKASQ